MSSFKLELGFVTDGDGMALSDEAFITFNDGNGRIEIEGAGAHDIGPILAAAPDMLAALRLVERGMRQWSIAEHAPEWKAIYDAIAKAEGRAA